MCALGSFLTELASLENFLAARPGVVSASADRTRALLHLSYDPAQTGIDELQQVL